MGFTKAVLVDLILFLLHIVKFMDSHLSFDIKEKYKCKKCIPGPLKYDLAKSSFYFDPYSKKLIHGFEYND